MLSLHSIVEQFNAPLQSRIAEVESAGKSFLRSFDQFPDSDIVDMVKNDSFRGYMIHVIKETTEDTEVRSKGVRDV